MSLYDEILKIGHSISMLKAQIPMNLNKKERIILLEAARWNENRWKPKMFPDLILQI
jgi:hypothetical protein